ncbi:MAG: sodium:calcium antiporter [Chitinophagales bacterium]
MAVIGSLLLISLSCYIIWKACDGFEVASEYLGRNLSEGVRGATINAIASSIPELFTTLFFLFIMYDAGGFAGGVGTTAGSAVFNGVVIPALVILSVLFFGVSQQVSVSKKVILRDGLFLILGEILLIYFISGTHLYWWHGLLLMLFYGVYVAYMLISMKKNEIDENEIDEIIETTEHDENPKSMLASLLSLDLESLVVGNREINNATAWPLLLIATGVIGAACAILVHGCEGLAFALNIPIYFIAVIVAAAATSVPDTIISVRDSMKGNYDDALSNALGSNIFDICFALGLPLFLFTSIYGPLTMSADTVADITELQLILLFITIIIFFLFYVGEQMGRIKAIVLLLIYGLFVSFIVASSADAQWTKPISEGLQNIVQIFDSIRFWI